ncbi:fungal-specific transcription factor domain-containing protein [Halenospora varia]|nr:fungal-specific transcription factor domain-containing protein [Halenospora varia]
MEDSTQSNNYPNPDASPRRGMASDQAKHKACDTCKRRKIRCSGSHPCQHCQRNDTSCNYTSTHGKLAILERQLAQSKKRTALLESAWHKFVPNIDLAYALHAVETQTAITSPSASEEAAPVPEVQVDSGDGGLRSQPNRNGTQPSPPIEGELDKEDTLEWDETADFQTLTDGIGSLSVNPKGSGYMGPQSGNALLRYLQSISNFFPGPEDDQNDDREPLNNHQLLIPQEHLASSTFTHCCIDYMGEDYQHQRKLDLPLTIMLGVIPKPKDGSWPLLMNIVLAIGAFAGPQSSENADTYFFNKARENLNLNLLQRGSLPLVQAFALMANYMQKRNKPNSGFTYLGIAYNLALGIGLHREFSKKSSSAFTMEIRRRVWWTLFIFDSGARLTFGRPTMILAGTNIKPPRNLHDSDISVDIGQLAQSQDHPTAASSLIWQSKLAEISNLANAMLLERQLPDLSLILSLDDRVKSWRRDLPAYFYDDNLDPEFSWFDIPRMVLLWRSWHLRIVVTRPFLLDIVKNRKALDATNANDPVGRCINSAQECVLSITNFCSARDDHPGGLMWSATYWLVTAVFVNVTCLLYDPYNELGPAWRQQVETSKLVLESMGTIEPIAKRAASILGKIMGLVPRSPDSMTFSYNEPMRMGIADIWGQSWIDPPVVDQNFEEVMQRQGESVFTMDRLSSTFWES